MPFIKPARALCIMLNTKIIPLPTGTNTLLYKYKKPFISGRKTGSKRRKYGISTKPISLPIMRNIPKRGAKIESRTGPIIEITPSSTIANNSASTVNRASNGSPVFTAFSAVFAGFCTI